MLFSTNKNKQRNILVLHFVWAHVCSQRGLRRTSANMTIDKVIPTQVCGARAGHCNNAWGAAALHQIYRAQTWFWLFSWPKFTDCHSSLWSHYQPWTMISCSPCLYREIKFCFISHHALMLHFCYLASTGAFIQLHMTWGLPGNW